MQMSISRELNENRNSWAAAIGLGIAAFSAKKKSSSDNRARQDAKDIEKKRLKQERRLDRENRLSTMATQASQQSNGIADVKMNPNYIYIGLTMIALLLLFMMGKR